MEAWLRKSSLGDSGDFPCERVPPWWEVPHHPILEPTSSKNEIKVEESANTRMEYRKEYRIE
jgi:hypothetical protein